MIFRQDADAPFELALTLVAEAEAATAPDEDELAALCRHVLAEQGAVGCWELAVALVGDARLQGLHREFMGIDTPTDIMTFPVADSDERQGGDLVISLDHARMQAGAWGLTPADEIRFLVIHGLLHLLGWTDESELDRSRMLERQTALLDQWRASGGIAAER